MKLCDLSFLLNDDCLTYYWVGFILADGYISKKFRLKITLAIKDELHLKRFVNLSGGNIFYDKKGKKCEIQAMDKFVLQKFVKKFDISNTKTYSPPMLSIENPDLLFSLLVGIIDGDGHLGLQTGRTHPKLIVKMHGNWFRFLHLFKEVCPSCIVKINGLGYAEARMFVIPELISLKKKALRLNLPILQRKWDHIDENYVTFYQKAEEKLNRIKSLCRKGYSIKHISDQLQLNYSGVYRAIKKHKLQ